MRLAERIKESLEQHKIIAACDHAFEVILDDSRRIQEFCPKCEGTFTRYKNTGG